MGIHQVTIEWNGSGVENRISVEATARRASAQAKRSYDAAMSVSGNGSFKLRINGYLVGTGNGREGTLYSYRPPKDRFSPR